MDFQHGKIVRALRNQVEGNGRVLKFQAIDLALISHTQVKLFEIKTSIDSQSIYTAIGQLYMHGAVLQREYPEKKLARCLVIPGTIDTRKREVLYRELGIAVISYEYNGLDTSFSGL